MKALIRDLKAYMNTKQRYIPIGYSSNDDPKIRLAIRDYMACGESNTKPDFLGINIYSWCGLSDYKTSGYKDRTEELEHYSMPVVLSETGCNVVRPRMFTEVLFYARFDTADSSNIWA
jgi:hypothetical protein